MISYLLVQKLYIITLRSYFDERQNKINLLFVYVHQLISLSWYVTLEC